MAIDLVSASGEYIARTFSSLAHRDICRRDPGVMKSPFPEHSRSLGLFEGFLACVINACFTVAGPDYLSSQYSVASTRDHSLLIRDCVSCPKVVAGEARNPRKTMPRAFNSTIYRLLIFFIGSALAIGILVPYNDP